MGFAILFLNFFKKNMHNFAIIIQLFYSYMHIFCILKFYIVFFTDNFLIILSFCYFISFYEKLKIYHMRIDSRFLK